MKNELESELVKRASFVKERDSFCFQLGLLMSFLGVLLAAITCGPRGVAKSLKGLLIGLVIVGVYSILLLTLPIEIGIVLLIFIFVYLAVSIMTIIENGEWIGYDCCRQG